MSRDPAFLFYDGDAARDVSHMNRLERGCYFDIIQAQRKFGFLSIDHVKKILGKDFVRCWSSIELVLSNENDLYFIQWLKDSSDRRKRHSEMQSERANKRWHNKTNATAMPRQCLKENENENENEKKERRFGKFWDKYPRKEGKKAALRHFMATVKTDQDWEDFKKAVDIYLLKIDTEKTKPEFIRQASTFVNNWRECLEYKQEPEYTVVS